MRVFFWARKIDALTNAGDSSSRAKIYEQPPFEFLSQAVSTKKCLIYTAVYCFRNLLLGQQGGRMGFFMLPMAYGAAAVKKESPQLWISQIDTKDCVDTSFASL